jgi:serine/threonine protein kinase
MYMVTDFAANGSLEDYLQKELSIDFIDKIGFLLDAAKGMEYLSSQKVLHRDLACRNLLVNRGNEVLIR